MFDVYESVTFSTFIIDTGWGHLVAKICCMFEKHNKNLLAVLWLTACTIPLLQVSQ